MSVIGKKPIIFHRIQHPLFILRKFYVDSDVHQSFNIQETVHVRSHKISSMIHTTMHSANEQHSHGKRASAASLLYRVARKKVSDFPRS